MSTLGLTPGTATMTALEADLELWVEKQLLAETNRGHLHIELSRTNVAVRHKHFQCLPWYVSCCTLTRCSQLGNLWSHGQSVAFFFKSQISIYLYSMLNKQVKATRTLLANIPIFYKIWVIWYLLTSCYMCLYIIEPWLQQNTCGGV